MTARQQSVPPWFGKRIQRERERRGWSVRELARKSGVAASTPLRIEAGQDSSLSSAIAVSSALGLSLDVLLAEPGCGVCDGSPPGGFICSECGRGATQAATGEETAR
jgi:transcriptional regulator with XRE-family HTH domain